MLLKNIFLGLALFSPPSTNAKMFGRKDPAGVLKADWERRNKNKLFNRAIDDQDYQDLLDPSLLSEDLDNLLEKLKYHGCQCSRFFNLYYDLDLEEDLIGGDHTVDELDAVCLNWYRARNCIESLPPAEVEHSSCSCTPNVDDVVLEMNDQGECVTNGYGPCSTDTCEIDAAYSSSFIDVVMDSLGENFTNGTDISKFEPQIVNEIGVCSKNVYSQFNAFDAKRVCTGTAPNFVAARVSSANHARKRREVNEDCDPAMVELLGQLGSCSFGYAAAADGQCVKNVCSCEKGLAVDLCDAAETTLCQSCDSGYYLDANQQCIANQCTCANGYGAVGPSCPSDGAAYCSGCHSGYTGSGGLCNQCASGYFRDYAAGNVCTNRAVSGYWIAGGYGQYLSCGSNTVLTGLCTSGKNADCWHNGNWVYSKIYCSNAATNPNAVCGGWQGDNGNYGMFQSCSQYTPFLSGFCGSGRDRDCDGNYARGICCDKQNMIMDLGQCYSVQTGDHGQDVVCPTGYAIRNYCGSGQNADCMGAYTNIQCCPFYAQ